MISGGNATVFVSDMDAAVTFYTEVLGLKLRFRAENYWAEVEAGDTLVIGLHPRSETSPEPGTRGAVQIGLTVNGDIGEVVKTLKERNVHFEGPIIEDDGAGSFVQLQDIDGNLLYLWQTKAQPLTN